MGMIKGFFGFEIFDSGIFLGRTIGQVFFGGGFVTPDLRGCPPLSSGKKFVFTPF